MQREQIRGTLKAILEEETGETIDSLPDEARIVEELGLDSVDVVSMVMRVEQKFRVRISHAELAGMTDLRFAVGPRRSEGEPSGPRRHIGHRCRVNSFPPRASPRRDRRRTPAHRLQFRASPVCVPAHRALS